MPFSANYQPSSSSSVDAAAAAETGEIEALSSFAER